MNLNTNSDMNDVQNAISTGHEAATEITPDIYGLGGNSLHGARGATGDEQFPDCAMHHAAYLGFYCAIEPAARNRRYFSVPENNEGRQWLAEWGFQGEQLSLGVGLAIPVHNSHGDLVEHLVQFDARRRDAAGNAIIYERVPRQAPVLDVTVANFEQLAHARTPIGWTLVPEYADSLPDLGIVGINLNTLYPEGAAWGIGEAILSVSDTGATTPTPGTRIYESVLRTELDAIPFQFRVDGSEVPRLNFLFLETDWREDRQSEASLDHSLRLVELAKALEERGGIVLLLNPPLEREIDDKQCLYRLLQHRTELERFFAGKPFSNTSEQRRLQAIRHLLG